MTKKPHIIVILLHYMNGILLKVMELFFFLERGGVLELHYTLVVRRAIIGHQHMVVLVQPIIFTLGIHPLILKELIIVIWVILCA